MPTQYIPAPQQDEEDDDSFAAGLTRDQNQVLNADRSQLGPTPVAATPETPPPPPAVPAPAGNADTPGITAPEYHPPDRSGLEQWQSTLQKDSAPINRKDPSVKPRWWERAVGGLAAGMMGFGGNPEAAAQAGGAVVNRRYNQAVQDQQTRMAADREGIAAEQDKLRGSDLDFQRSMGSFNAQDLANQRNARADELRAQEQQRLSSAAPETLQPLDPANPLGPWKGKTVGGKDLQINQPPDSWLKTPAGILATNEQRAIRAGIKPGTRDWQDAIVNGKLEKTPTTNIHIPSAEAQQYSDWKSAFRRANGRDPNADEVANYKPGGSKASKPVRGTPQQFSQLDAQTDTQYKKAKADYDLTVSSRTVTPEERAAAAAELASENSRIGYEHSQRLRDLGGIPAEDSQQAATPQSQVPQAIPAVPLQQQRQVPPAIAPPSPPATTPGAPAIKVKAGTVTIGTPVTDGKRQGTVTGINPTSGKPIVQWR